MNISSGRGPLSDGSTNDTNWSSINTVSDTDRAVTVGSVPVTCSMVTPVKAAPHASVYGMQSPNVFTGYPVLTLPTLGGSARQKPSPVRSPHNISPRNSRSPATPRRSRSLANKTPPKGQPCIDQFYTKTVSSHSASMSHSSSSPLISQSSLSLDRKRTEPARVAVSPLLSRNQWDVAKMPTAKVFQSSNISAVGFNRSDKNSAVSDTQRDKCSVDTVSAVKTSLVEQKVSVDVMPETAAIKNTLSAIAEVQPESLKVSSTGCSNSTVSSRKYSKERTDACQSPLKISMPVLQKMRKIWERNCTAVSGESVKSCSSDDVTSEPSVSLSALAVGAELNSVVTNSGCPPVSLYAASASTSAEISASTTVASSHKNSAVVNVEVGDIVSCMDTCDINQQHVASDSVAHDGFKAESDLAVIMDVSNDECSEANPSTKSVGDAIDTATCKSLDSANTNQQIVVDGGVKNNSNNRGETLPVSATEVDVRDKVKLGSVNGRDNHMDVDSYALEDFTPVESKPFNLLLLAQQKHESIYVCFLRILSFV